MAVGWPDAGPVRRGFELRQYHPGMAEKVTLSLSADTLARARRAAHREGVSVSGWFERAARRQLLRDAAVRHDEWLAANPDVREELDGFDRLAETLDSSWSDLPGAA
jgi:uncharacterized lipoprotein YddW (UPF0748 family)